MNWRLASKVMLLGLSGAVISCGHDDGLEEEGCYHREHGPHGSSTATAAVNDAAVVELEHHNNAVSLVNVTGGHGGFIKFEVAHEDEYVIYLDQAVEIAVRSDADDEVVIDESVSNIRQCPDLMSVYYVVDLQAGVYSLEFLPSQHDTLNVVLTPAVRGHSH